MVEIVKSEPPKAPLYKVGDRVEVIRNLSKHRFLLHEELRILRVYPANWDDNGILNACEYDACNDNGDCSYIFEFELIDCKQTRSMKLMKQAVKDTANRLCQANNTVTTLELKVELRKTHPYFHWIQNSRNGLTGVSEYMIELEQEGHFTFTDNGQYRVYSAVAPVKVAGRRGRPRKQNSVVVGPQPSKVVVGKNPNHNVRSISRQKALDLMSNNKGHFFTAVFIKKDGIERTINCQYMKDQKTNPAGYVMVKEAGKMKMGDNPIRQINLQTLRSLRIGGQNFNVRK